LVDYFFCIFNKLFEFHYSTCLRERLPGAQLAAVADKNWALGKRKLERRHVAVAAFVAAIVVNKSMGKRQMPMNNSVGPKPIVDGHHLQMKPGIRIQGYNITLIFWSLIIRLFLRKA
jgi:hypothetical protein